MIRDSITKMLNRMALQRVDKGG